MEFLLNDPQVPRLPPEKTHILALRAEPYPDGVRVRVNLELTPFQQPPYIELALSDSEGIEVNSVSIVEPMGWKLELTLHIRPSTSLTCACGTGAGRAGKYTLAAHLSYPDLGEIDQRQVTFQIQPPID